MKSLFKQCLSAALCAAAVATTMYSGAAPAQKADWSNKPITWVVGWGAGGSADTVTRLVARHLEQELHTSIVIENRPGASGTIALRMAASAPPDGYTLITVPGPVILAMKAPEVGNELAGVTELARGPMVLVGTTAEPMPSDVQALFKAMKANPGKYNYASSGNGTSQHLTGELMKQLGGVEMTHIPYKGGTQAATDVIGGQVSLGVLGITSVLPHIKSGKLRAYAVSTKGRVPSLPDVPSVNESVLPGFDASQWFVLAAPKGTPADRIKLLNEKVAAILKRPDIADGFANVGVAPSAASPQDTTTFVTGEQQRWQTLATESNLPLN